MPDDKMFDYILARSRTRESSTLTIATVAASASLVLLALYVEAQMQACVPCTQNLLSKHEFWIVFFGMVFPIAGILYREVTAATIHNNDERWLGACIRKSSKECLNMKDEKERDIKNPMCYSYCNRIRAGTFRSLLAIPIIAWTLVVDTAIVDAILVNTIIAAKLIVLVGSGIYIIGLTLYERKD